MKKIVDYKIAFEAGHKPLEDEAAHLLSSGWQPWGPLQLADDPGESPDYVQVFVKYEEGESSND